MTLTVQDKRTVKAEGTWPYDMEATYYNTGNKGSVTSKDTATLSLSGLDGVQVEKVLVYLRSNKSAGAGVITMTADGQQLYSKQGTYEDWFGAYDNTNYQPIGWSGTKKVNALEVQIIGTTNSLHIEKYEITWTQAQEHSVTLMKGDSLVETLHGTTVELPVMDDVNNWHFEGWTTAPFYQKGFEEDALYSGTYKPTADIVLWAVYSYRHTIEEAQVTELEDGYFIYANMQNSMAMSGGVTSGVIGSDPISESPYYLVEFSEDQQTATIQVSDNVYIGFSGKTIASKKSQWQVYHEGTKTAFYTTYNSETYMLLPGMLGEDDYYYTVLRAVDNIADTFTALLAVPETGVIIITCYPQYGLGIENVANKEERGEVVVPFGIYNLKIINGRKYLELR